MIAVSCPVCQHSLDDSSVESGKILYCPSCNHRLKLRAGKLVNLGINASGEHLRPETTDPQITTKTSSKPTRKSSKKSTKNKTRKSQNKPREKKDKAEDIAALSQSTEPLQLERAARARRNARLTTRRHQQTAVVWLLAGTMFVVLAVSFLIIAGPDRFTNIYRPKQLSEAKTTDPNAPLDNPQSPQDPNANLASGQLNNTDRNGTTRTVLIDPNADSKEKRASIFSAPILPEHYPPIEAKPLFASPWRQPTEPLTPYDGLAQISLQNEKLVKIGQNQSRFTADLIYDGQDTIDSLNLKLGLVNPQGQLIATMTQPIGLLDYTRPQRIITTIPPAYADRTSKVMWSADIGQRVRGGIPIGNITVRPTGKGDDTVLMINAVNPVKIPLGKASFLLTAYNNHGVPVMRWRMDWAKRVEPNQGFYFKAVTPVQPVWAVKRWIASGIAIPATASNLPNKH